MDIQLICSDGVREELKTELAKHGLNVVSDSTYVFIDKGNTDKQYLIGKDEKKNISLIQYDDIIFFESFNNTTEVVTTVGRFEVKEKLYELEKRLYAQDFIRVNKSALVNMMCIVKIIPWIGNKYVLELKDNARVEVTRTYSADFKKRLGF